MKAEGHKHSKVQTELAGYVVFRNDPEGSRFYLLLEESESPHRWTVPKGTCRVVCHPNNDYFCKFLHEIIYYGNLKLNIPSELNNILTIRSKRVGNYSF